MFTADDEIYIISQLPPSVSANKQSRWLFLTLVLSQIHASTQQNPFLLYLFNVRMSRNPSYCKASINNTLFCLCNHADILAPCQTWASDRDQHTCMQQRLLHFYPCHPPQRGLGWETCISPFPAEENRRACSEKKPRGSSPLLDKCSLIETVANFPYTEKH